MVKTIIKETFIVILLLIAITLLLGIMFYGYIPVNKTVPSKIQAYSPSTEIEEELKSTVDNNGKTQEIVYQIDALDLSSYQYSKTKVNPFAEYTEPVDNTTVNGTPNTTGNTTTQNGTKTVFSDNYNRIK